MHITFLIGNGFDINLGMQTKYSDMYEGYLEAPSKSKVIQTFKTELSNRKPYDKWTDFEMGMADYAKTLSSEKDLIECVRDFKTYLVRHLENEDAKAQELFSAKGNDWPIVKELNDSLERFYETLPPNIVYEIKELIGQEVVDYHYLTFNYTSTLEQVLNVKRRFQKSILDTPIHIHGTLNNDVVLGVDNLNQLNGISYTITNRGQRTFVKTLFNKQYDKQRILKAQDFIQKSKIICVYGWSMGNSDDIWVQTLREWILANPSNHLVFFKYSTTEYQRYNFDEIMDAEDDEKEKIMQRLGISDESILNQIHIPIGYNIFNFGKVSDKSANEVMDKNLFMAINT